ncbi:MAG: molybdopterin molybdotransferase MoeA [Chloroflexi bacterium]|nr:MAG: molybdopterin molybdotransferase MoeA [Chloroflexota bacterium]
MRTAPRAEPRALTVDEALARILERFTPLPAEEQPILDALGQVLDEDVRAANDVPPFANSAMDGYAVRAAELAITPVLLPIAMEIPAGSAATTPLQPGSVARIMTGAPLPAGADAVVRVEDTDGGERVVEIRKAVAGGENVRAAGEDLRKGELVLQRGLVVRAAEVGVLATAGRASVHVVRRPRVAVLSTGDEVVEVHEALEPGKIRDANRWSLAAAVRAAGGIAVPLGIARDTADDLRRALRRAAEEDVIVTSGGVSVGDYDFVKTVVGELGAMDFWTIAMRPGKPVAFGEVLDKPIFGLPGNPVSALLTFELFARPALLKLQGRTRLRRPRVTARLTEDVPKPPHLRFFARAIYDSANGTVRSTGPQGSGILRSMALANALIDLPIGPSLAKAGSEVTVILTDAPEDR